MDEKTSKTDEENTRTLLCVTHERLRNVVDEMMSIEIDFGVGVNMLYGQKPPADFLGKDESKAESKKAGSG